MKLATHIYLDEHNIPYQVCTFPVDTEKGAANVAHALGYQARQMVKTLILQTGEGEMAMVLIGGDQKAISGHLKKAIGSRNIRMASFEAIEEVTGYKSWLHSTLWLAARGISFFYRGIFTGRAGFRCGGRCMGQRNYDNASRFGAGQPGDCGEPN